MREQLLLEEVIAEIVDAQVGIFRDVHRDEGNLLVLGRMRVDQRSWQLVMQDHSPDPLVVMGYDGLVETGHVLEARLLVPLALRVHLPSDEGRQEDGVALWLCVVSTGPKQWSGQFC